jgi:solute carrier family 12 sodium/potassium/chloride transporter 2
MIIFMLGDHREQSHHRNCNFQGPLNNRQRNGLNEKAQNWFRSNRVKAFFNVVDDMTFEDGSKALLQASGVGKLRPNILLLGYKNNWPTCAPDELKEYFNTIQYVSVTVYL